MRKPDNNGEATTPTKFVAIALIILLFALGGCGEAPEIKIVDRVSGHFLDTDTGLVIREIAPNGGVSLGVPGGNVGVWWDFSSSPTRPYVLEGKAAVGDPVAILYLHEDLLLESGEVWRRSTGVKVLSTKNNVWEEYFSQAKAE